jgi:RHS repeat-associated protein
MTERSVPSEQGLDYAVNRYYSSIWASFLSPDPSLPSNALVNPENWNKYAYVGGDPVNKSDPLGFCSPNDDPPCYSVTVTEFLTGAEGGGGSSANGFVYIPTPWEKLGMEKSQYLRYLGQHTASEWNAFSPDCQGALETAMPKTGISGMVAAVDRAKAAESILVAATAGTDISWAMLAAIGIRESGFRDIPQANGGMGRGIFQIDIGKNPSVTEDEAYDTVFAANWAANRLANNMTTLVSMYPNLTSGQLLQATAASYNFGTKNISGNPNTIDVGTTGNNYGSNVVDLMDCFH